MSGSINYDILASESYQHKFFSLENSSITMHIMFILLVTITVKTQDKKNVICSANQLKGTLNCININTLKTWIKRTVSECE